MRTSSETPRSGLFFRPFFDWWWLGLIIFALVEVSGHAVIRSRVPPLADWKAAAALVREQLKPRDAITVAPAWTDPVLRWFLGDRISPAMAGRSDLAAYDRLWALSIRDARPEEAPAYKPELVRRFGRVQVLRWKLPESTVVFDLVEQAPSAEVTLVRRGVERPCPLQRLAPGPGGGLGLGVIAPAERAVCDRGRSWLWVAPVVTEDLDLKPRRCVWQHPDGAEPIRVAFHDVPLGRSMVFYGGLYYEHERMRQGGPVQVSILINNKRVAKMVHLDGEGWKRLSFSTRDAGQSQPKGDIAVEVSAEHPHRRGFCWAATVRNDSVQGARP